MVSDAEGVKEAADETSAIVAKKNTAQRETQDDISWSLPQVHRRRCLYASLKCPYFFEDTKSVKTTKKEVTFGLELVMNLEIDPGDGGELARLPRNR